MAEEKDICVRMYITGADWIGLRALAKHHGLSQSAFLRQMLMHAIEHHAREQIRSERPKEEDPD